MKLEFLWIYVSLVSGLTAGPLTARSLASFSSFASSYPHCNPKDHKILRNYHLILNKNANSNLRLSASTSSSAVPFSSPETIVESDTTTNFANLEATNTIQVINNQNSKKSLMEYNHYMDGQARNKKVHSRNRKQKKKKSPTSDPEFLMKRTLQITSKHEKFASSSQLYILRSVHWLIDAWINIDTSFNKTKQDVKLTSIQSLFDSLEELYHVKPTSKTWAHLIKAYGQEKGGQYTIDILHQIPASERNAHCYAEVLDSLAHEIMMAQSEARYRRNGAMTHLQCSSSKDTSLANVAQELLQQMIDKDNLPTPNARCFHAVIRAWGHECNPPAAQACMSLMQTLHSQGKIDDPPNRYCYNAVLYAWANAGKEWNAEMAEEFLNQMTRDARVYPNIVSYNLCIAAWAKIGNGERAENILRNMDSNKNGRHHYCKPNTMTYNTVINAYAKSSDVNAAENAERLLIEMKKCMEEEGIDSHVKPDFFSFSTVINAWGRSLNSGKVNKVMKILNEMENDYNIRPNGESLVSLNVCMCIGIRNVV